MTLYKYLVGIAVLALLSGCSETSSTPDDTTKPVPDVATGESDSEETPTLDDVEKELGEAARTTKEFASKEMQEYADSLDSQLQDLDTRLDQLKQQGDELAGDAKQRWQDQMTRLNQKRSELRDDLDKVRDAGSEAWQELKQGIDAAWDDLKKATDEAAQELDQGNTTPSAPR